MSCSTLVNHDDVTDIVRNMLRQEVTTYRRIDYLATELRCVTDNEVIDGCWRQRIIEWMYGVVDHCNLRRESVAVATYFLDLSASRGLVRCRRDFQLVAMTSLMLSIKLNDSTSVKLDSMVKLGRGLFNEADVIAMETEMLHVLDWHVHPPTPVCFMRQLLRLLPPETSAIARYMIMEVTRFISEVSTCIYKFIKYSSSSMSMAAMKISMERIDTAIFPREQSDRFLQSVSSFTGIDYYGEAVARAADELRASLENNVNLQDLMTTIDAQCHRVSGGLMQKLPADVEMHEIGLHSPRDVSSSTI
ncbi:unnamed protein product [Cylindrotheca closterium]|uniref:Cyclin-like domain-containing protein n=1 Tax=Cylindrotheca closterium TaxID=2856 RepID=A0AAD2CK68_9STRA|nr:unnamed protein product [Cylindrotheca closterium]